MSFLSKSYDYLIQKWRKQAKQTKKKHSSISSDDSYLSVKYFIKLLNGKYIDDFSTKKMNLNSHLSFHFNKKEGHISFNEDHITIGGLRFSGDNIQWLGRYKNWNSVNLDICLDQNWYIVHLNPHNDESQILEKILSRTPEKLRRSRYFYRPEIRTYSGARAHIMTRTLQGIFQTHEAVELYVTPLWMVVLNNDRVYQQHFIDDIKDIRSSQHPMNTQSDTQILTFEVKDKAYAYALKNTDFVTRLSDAAREGIDKASMRKKKQ